MLNVTLKFSFYCLALIFCSCAGKENKPTAMEVQHFEDSVSEARIDSAFALIKTNCDTLMVKQIPQMVDSFLKDSALLDDFFVGNNVYTDPDKKVEKVIRQLLADCDSSLQKETYRIAQLRLRSKQVKRKKLKA